MTVHPMLLFIDTETSGLIDFTRSVDHPEQPHIVQIAALLCEDDIEGTLVETFQSLIKPDGWEIQREAEAVHHISKEYAVTFGERLDNVLNKFYSIVKRADEAGFGRLVAHNVTFDLRMILRDAYTVENFEPRFVNNLRPFCTMRAMTMQCRLPSRRRGEYKWPKLEEAYEYTFGTKPPAAAAHTALGDAAACRELFIEGRKRGWWS